MTNRVAVFYLIETIFPPFVQYSELWKDIVQKLPAFLYVQTLPQLVFWAHQYIFKIGEDVAEQFSPQS